MDSADRSFWSGKKVLLTGHTGFKGGWLALWLTELGAEVHGLSLPPYTTPSMYEAISVKELLASEHLIDLQDLDALKAAFSEVQPEVVFHLAAQSLVRESYLQPLETIASNTMGTVHVLEALRATPSVRSAVIVTTDKVYRNQEWRWGYREHEALGGHDPYSASKAAADILTTCYRLSFFKDSLGLVTVRAGNVLGGGTWNPYNLIPDTIKAFSKGEAVGLRMPGATRPWQHVLDPLRGYIRLAEVAAKSPGEWSEPFNLGPDNSSVVTVERVVNRIAEIWGDGATWNDESDPSLPHEAGLLSLDSTAVRQRLHWAPKIDLETCLQLTVTWYKAYYSGATPQQMRALTWQQITEHQ